MLVQLRFLVTQLGKQKGLVPAYLKSKIVLLYAFIYAFIFHLSIGQPSAAYNVKIRKSIYNYIFTGDNKRYQFGNILDLEWK